MPQRRATPFSDQYDAAGLLSGVDPGLAQAISQSGLMDGDPGDDKVKTSQKVLPAVALKPSQSTVVLSDAVGIALEMLHQGGGQGEDLGAMVSSDSYILDGHHRWAGAILARGRSATVKVWLADLPAVQLVRVLNLISKGMFGATHGNPGKGSIRDLTAQKVRAQLEVFAQKGRQHKHFSPTAAEVQDILTRNFGSVEDGITTISKRASLIPKNIPSWAPPREQMPVIRTVLAPAAAKVLNQGVIDWSAPYSDASRVAHRFLGLNTDQGASKTAVARRFLTGLSG